MDRCLTTFITFTTFINEFSTNLPQICSNRNRRTNEGATYGADGNAAVPIAAAAAGRGDAPPSLSDSEEEEDSTNNVRTAEVQVHRPWGTYTR